MKRAPRALVAVVFALTLAASSVTLTWAAAGGPRLASTYYPPCTAQTLGCHQSRLNSDDAVINGLRSSVASLAARPTPTVTATKTVTSTPTVTPTPTPTPTPTVTPTPTPTPSSTAFACTVPLGGSCPTGGSTPGYLSKATWPGSNGYNTYVSNQAFGGGPTETLSANSPGDWQVFANLTRQGGSILTFPNVQQLTNNWGSGGWNGSADTPLDSLTSLKINYDETSPGGSNGYEFAPDIFQDNYGSNGGGDVMFWVDTNGRCDVGSFGSTLLGHFTMGGQGWTAHRYGNTYGDEIILVLDGSGGQGTCAQQSSGSIDVKAAFAWLSAGGWIPAHPVLSIIQTGWEMTGESNATFRLHSYSIVPTL